MSEPQSTPQQITDDHALADDPGAGWWADTAEYFANAAHEDTLDIDPYDEQGEEADFS
jgi:hypothetical protein